MALKRLFSKKIAKIAKRLGALPPDPHSGNAFSHAQFFATNNFQNRLYRVFESTNVVTKCNYYCKTLFGYNSMHFH